MRFVTALVFVIMAAAAQAQDRMWIQIEARPSLPLAADRAELYAGRLPDVAGFALRSGWYAVALGPYPRTEARRRLGRLKSSGAIPSDSFLASRAEFGAQFFGGAAAAPAPDIPQPERAAGPLREPTETRAQAAASERDLTRAEKELLQIAMQAEGVYRGAIDGLYGKGTRAAMALWQEANRYPPTGILTTAQRAELLAAYNAVLDGMDMQTVQDDAAGVRMVIPTGAVKFASYDAPFARFDATGLVDEAQVVMISQAGDRTALTGLYELLQTLELMPREGDRSLSNSSFRIEGLNDTRHSTAVATLKGGEIKGFVLVWPAGDAKRRARILSEIERSFARTDGVLDPALSAGNGQSVDMVSGLAIRQPLMVRSGFFVNDAGDVVTSGAGLDRCGEITIEGAYPATVALNDGAGLAVLRPSQPQSPRATAVFQASEPRLQSRVALAGFPYGGVLTTAAVTFGTLADLRGLSGEPGVNRLTLVASDTEAGGPVFDNAGHVVGMLLPHTAPDGKILPQDVAFTLPADRILPALTAAGITVAQDDAVAFATPERITQAAARMTVLVRCWD